MTTGSQGEPMSGLFRMANASHKLNVGQGDTVIVSSSAIPGNEVSVARVINHLYEKGVRVVYDKRADVHVSGHACREELKLMISIIRPKYFIPVHGEMRHLQMHAELAEQMGIPRENIFVPERGGVIEITSRKAVSSGTVPCGFTRWILTENFLEETIWIYRVQRSSPSAGTAGQQSAATDRSRWVSRRS